MLHAAYLMPLLPLAGFVVLALFGRRLGDPWAGWFGTVAVLASFVVACVTYVGLLGQPSGVEREFVQNLYNWIPVGGLQVKAQLLVDPLSMTMALFVTGISALINLYSIGYMRRDKDFPKFFAYLNLFVASMLLLILGGNMLFTFIGWEGVGVCSYWLISYWFERESAASAGKKAFIYNRVGDVGFLLAMFLVFSKTGSLQYSVIFHNLGALGGVTGTAVCLLLFLAATGKSAQIPLFPWLPDAMEGPTPVSALIHAATMVTAGVYLMCRFSPVLHLTHDAQIVVATVGAVTAFVAATIACAQNDIKKVLAFSTVSQLGYMFLAVGCGAYEAAIFLMVAHAFFKGVLFLGSGSVIHGLGDEQDLKKMGGLARYMPLTAITFGVGWLAIAGVPPLSGFWAKGDILENAFARFRPLWAIGVVTALLTAYYMSRLFVLAFIGPDRWRAAQENAATPEVALAAASQGAHEAIAEPHGIEPHGIDDHGSHEPHEPPFVMKLPLVVLATLALLGGLLELPWKSRFSDFLGWLGPVFGTALYNAHQTSGQKWLLSIVDAALAVIGITIAAVLWRRANRPALEPKFLRRVWFVDDLYDSVIGKPGALLAFVLAYIVDNKVIDGAVNGLARLTQGLGSGLRRTQTGFVRQYAIGIVLGTVGLLGWMLMRAWS